MRRVVEKSGMHRGEILLGSVKGGQVTWLALLSVKVQHPGTNLRRLTMASKKISWMAVSQSQLAVNGVGVGATVAGGGTGREICKRSGALGNRSGGKG